MTKSETLELIKRGLSGKVRDRFEIVSEWVIEERDEYEKTIGYPYLKQVEEWIIKKHALDLSTQEAADLHTLIFNAAAESRKRQDAAEGWTNASLSWLEANTGKKVEMKSEGIFGKSVITVKVVRVGDNFYLMPPRARTRGYYAYDKKVREVSRAKVA